jgi:hypothetical protein
MQNDDTKGHTKAQQYLVGVVAFGLILGGLRLVGFYLHIWPNLWAWVAGIGILGMVGNWLLNKPKPFQNRTVSERTKVAKDGTVFQTTPNPHNKPELNKSAPKGPADPWFVVVEPAQAGGAQAVLAKPNAFAGIGEWINEHRKGLAMFVFGLIGAGFWVAAVMLGLKASETEVALGYVVGMFICLAAGGILIALATGMLRSLGTWAGEHLAVVWFIFSGICLFCFGLSAYEGAYIWHWNNWEWIHVAVIVAMFSVFLTGLYLAGVLGEFGEEVGKMLMKAHFGGFLYSMSVVLWLFWMTAIALFWAMATRSPIFDRMIEAARAGEFAAIGSLAAAGGLGFFLFCLAVVFDFKRPKK